MLIDIVSSAWSCLLSTADWLSVESSKTARLEADPPVVVKVCKVHRQLFEICYVRAFECVTLLVPLVHQAVDVQKS